MEKRDTAAEQAQKNTAESGGDSFRRKILNYSKQQIENWKSSKKIVVYENQEQLQDFVDSAIHETNDQRKMYFGTVGQELADDIQRATGFKLFGKNITLRADNVRKTLKSHGNAKKEALRGQRAITPDDFKLVPIVIAEPDNILPSPEKYNGNTTVVYKKVYDNVVYYVEEIIDDGVMSTKQMIKVGLRSKPSFLKKIKKIDSRTPTTDVTSISSFNRVQGTPPGEHVQDEVSSAVNDNISQPIPIVNTGDAVLDNVISELEPGKNIKARQVTAITKSRSAMRKLGQISGERITAIIDELDQRKAITRALEQVRDRNATASEQIVDDDVAGVARGVDAGYNNTINEMESVDYERRENDSRKNRRIHETMSGEQTGTSIRGRGTLQTGVYQEGRTKGDGGSGIYSRDSERRGIKESDAEKDPQENKPVRKLGTYTQHQIDNWSGSKRIEIYKDESQFREFISDALENKNLNKKMYLGIVTSELAAHIKEKTGIDLEGYNCSLSAYEIRKILLNSHGNETKEKLRGQRKVSEEDILAIPNIISSPDNITLDSKLYEGRPVIKFQKYINGKTTVVSYVSKKHMDLSVQTMYAGQNKRSLATPPGGESPFPQTSETLSGIASNKSIPQGEKKINSNIKESDKGTHIVPGIDNARSDIEPDSPAQRWDAERIKNTERDEDRPPLSLSELVAKIKHDFGINITFGHVRGKDVRGQYNRNDKGVRTKVANNLPTIAHELGHHSDNVFSLRQTIPADTCTNQSGFCVKL